MNITYLIGNGFDKNLGLHTGYQDFYKYYLKLPREDLPKIVSQFREDLDAAIEDWSDLELSLGRYLKRFHKEDIPDIITLLDDLQDSLADYLDGQDVNTTITETDKVKLKKDLIYPMSYLNEKDKMGASLIDQKKNEFFDKSIFVILFNYTKTFEKLFDCKEKKILKIEQQNEELVFAHLRIEHIHGSTDRNMLLGINDPLQIENDEIRKDEDLQQAIVKPYMNENTGSLRAKRCKESIYSADLICIFGMSLGETDRLWWEHIIAALLKKPKLAIILFSRSNEINLRREYRTGKKKKEAIIEKFLSYSSLDATQKNSIKERIYVCLGSKMLKLKDGLIKL